ncbi:MAG: hypothetical protein AAF600_21655 [Bacteroidota bacterium]
MTPTLEIKPKSVRSRWVALSLDTNEIIAEGVKPETVAEKAEKSGVPYIMQFVPDPKSTYIL